MIQAIRSWIIEISTVVLFITAVEMLLPDNSLKKYSKFVLGLILMTVLINPLIKLFNNDFNVSVYNESILKIMDEGNYEKKLNLYKEKTVKSTWKNFERNLENIILEKLKEKFPYKKYKVVVKVEFDDKNNRFDIRKIIVEVDDKIIQKVKKIKINLKQDKNENKNESDNKFIEIKKYLSCELGVSKDKISVYKG